MRIPNTVLLAVLLMGTATASLAAQAPKKVALVSVYGQEKLPGNQSNQPNVDYAEAAAVAVLASKGFEVLPLAKTAAAIQKGWDEAYYNALDEQARKDLQARGQDYKDYFSALKRNNQMIHSAHTGLPKDYLRLQVGNSALTEDFENVPPLKSNIADNTGSDDRAQEKQARVFNNSPAFRRALGALAKQQGADAYVLVRALTTRFNYDDSKNSVLLVDSDGEIKGAMTGVHMASQIDMVMVGTSGEELFKRKAWGVSDDKFSMMDVMRMRYDEKKSAAFLEDAITRAMARIVSKTAAAGPKVAIDDAVFAAPSEDEALVLAATSGKYSAAKASSKQLSKEEVAGTWVLQTINGEPLPYNTSNGAVMVSQRHTLKPDGSFESQFVTMQQDKNGPVEKKSDMKGTYELNGSTIELKPKGLMVKLVLAVVGNPPLEVNDDGQTAKSIYNSLTYNWKKQ